MSVRRIPGRTHYHWFTCRAAGVPATLSGTPAISVYSGAGGVTQFTTGVTLVVDYDGVTGYNRLAIDMTDATTYPFSEDFGATITTGTVGGSSVVGEVVITFNTRLNNEGIKQAGVAATGSNTVQIVMPAGRFAGITVGNWVMVDGIGEVFIEELATTNTANDTLLFPNSPLTATSLGVFVRVFAAPRGVSTLPFQSTMVSSAAGALDGALDGAAGVETNLTLRGWFRLGASALFSKNTGAGTGTEKYRDFNDTKDRLTATIDGSFNRTAVTRDAS
jgi:hypothetical protein